MKDILKIYFRQNVACDVGQISTGLGQGTKNFMDEKISSVFGRNDKGNI